MKPVSLDSQWYDYQSMVETYQLGELRREFAPNVRVYMILLALLPIVMLFVFSHSYDPENKSFFALWLPIYALIVLSCLTGLMILYRGRKRRIFVYEHGLLAVRTNNIEVIRWDEIVIVWHRFTRNKNSVTHDYTPQRRDGRQFKLGYFFSTNQALGGIIEQETTHLLLPEALASYQQGQSLFYGPFTLDQSGLSYKGKSLLWSEVANFQVARGHVVIKKYNKLFAWADVVYGEVPNLRVFERLCKMILHRPDERYT
ncbi:DUF6585 family protein [Ktedonospora formicarum]|uniref:Uncharacterized protein n=1 Tax=Ktedonospora formicarum TaxID=2778364 RepID=A0A8J3I0J2_9CHLR|nr:DUF6585 family protein [Ktedonospora formicarum]GHO47732.1 hypothetical protein KSX_58950 [Ktedonospora formicarum]